MKITDLKVGDIIKGNNNSVITYKKVIDLLPNSIIVSKHWMSHFSENAIENAKAYPSKIYGELNLKDYTLVEPKWSALNYSYDWRIDNVVKDIGYLFTNDVIKLKLCVEQAEKKGKIELAELISAMIGDRVFSMSSGDVSRERASDIGDDICDYLKKYIIK